MLRSAVVWTHVASRPLPWQGWRFYSHPGYLRAMKKLLIGLVVLALVGVGFLSTQGLFTSVEVKQGEQGGHFLVGKHHMGPYYTIGDVFTELHSQSPDAHFMGVYFDDPDTTPEDSCRSFAGWQVASAAAGLEWVAAHPDYSLFEIKKRRSMYCDWPHPQGLGMLMGTFKAYPALGEAAVATGDFTLEGMVAFEDYGEESMRFVMQY